MKQVHKYVKIARMYCNKITGVYSSKKKHQSKILLLDRDYFYFWIQNPYLAAELSWADIVKAWVMLDI